MNSNPYILPSLIFLAITGLWLVLYVALTRRFAGSATGRHARPHLGRHEFADPADRHDPDGAGYVGQLLDPPAGEPDEPADPAGTSEPDWLDEDELDAGWWAQNAPPPRVDVLTGPGTRIAQTSALTMNVLARVRDRLAELDTGEDPAIDDTGEIPAAVSTWGKTAAELADELAEKYLAAPHG